MAFTYGECNDNYDDELKCIVTTSYVYSDESNVNYITEKNDLVKMINYEVLLGQNKSYYLVVYGNNSNVKET